MDNFVNSIGGYNSWQFCVLAFGLFSVGMGLRIWKVYFMPIPLAGVVLLTLCINHQVSLLPSSTDPMFLGVAGIFPILFVAICVLVLIEPNVLVRVFLGGKTDK